MNDENNEVLDNLKNNSIQKQSKVAIQPRFKDFPNSNPGSLTTLGNIPSLLLSEPHYFILKTNYDSLFLDIRISDYLALRKRNFQCTDSSDAQYAGQSMQIPRCPFGIYLAAKADTTWYPMCGEVHAHPGLRNGYDPRSRCTVAWFICSLFLVLVWIRVLVSCHCGFSSCFNGPGRHWWFDDFSCGCLGSRKDGDDIFDFHDGCFDVGEWFHRA